MKRPFDNPIDAWLKKHKAQRVTSSARSTLEMYIIGKRTVIVQWYGHLGGWEVFVQAHEGNSVTDTLETLDKLFAKR